MSMHRMLDDETLKRISQLDRERQERLRERIERRGDPSLERRPKRDTAPVMRSRLTADEIDERINAAVEANYDVVSKLVVEVLAMEGKRNDDERDAAIRKLRGEIAELAVKVADLKVLVLENKVERSEKGASVDLPNPLLRHRTQFN
jgi:hypothetical protein